MKKALSIFAILIVSLASCRHDKGPLPVTSITSTNSNGCDSTVHYSTNINAIVSTNCAIPHCHSSGSTDGDFTSYAGLSAKVANDQLHNRVVVLKDMPQGGPPLSDTQIKSIDCWIKQGGPNN